MKNRRKPALALRLYVDEHDQTFWEVYERASNAVLYRVRTAAKLGFHPSRGLSRLLVDIAEISA